MISRKQQACEYPDELPPGVPRGVEAHQSLSNVICCHIPQPCNSMAFPSLCHSTCFLHSFFGSSFLSVFLDTALNVLT